MWFFSFAQSSFWIFMTLCFGNMTEDQYPTPPNTPQIKQEIHRMVPEIEHFHLYPDSDDPDDVDWENVEYQGD